MKYHFTKTKIEEIITELKAAHEQGSIPKLTWSQKEQGLDPDLGLWLVGDQGVYFISNCGHIPNEGTLCYADEVNPHTLDFDDWYSNKRAGFGGDDGVEFFSLNAIEDWIKHCSDSCVMEISSSQIRLMNS